MGYLSNTELTVDAILTKKGREKLAAGQGLNITQFALADDEIDYSLYEPAHPLGSAYYDVAIKNMPVLEANPDETQVMKYKLVTLPKNTTRIPVVEFGVPNISVNQRSGEVSLSPTTSPAGNRNLGYTLVLANNNIRSILNNMAVIRDNRGALLASNLSQYLAGAANTAGTPIDTNELVRIMNNFLGQGEQISGDITTITNGIYKKFGAIDKVTNRTEIVTSGIWSGDTGSLSTFFTSSAQTASSTAKYYVEVYNQNPSSDGAEVQFSIAYGDSNGFGAPTLEQDDNSTMATKAVYNQFKNILLDRADEFFSVYSGSTAGAHDLKNFYAINVNRARYKERLDPGNFSLKLTGTTRTVTLIDDSGGTDENVTTAGRVYNLVSGSLNIGSALTASINSYVASNNQGYGLFYPDMGVILLNPNALSASVGVELAPASSSVAGQNHNLNGSIKLLKTIEAGADFQARRTENVSTSHFFVRANNREFNFSNNPTFVTGSTGQFSVSTFERDPKVYITTVGLYDDANELLAVAKVSKPVEKSFDKEVAIKVKLDF